MKPNCSPVEKTFTVELTEWELVMCIAGLWHIEHEAIKMAALAEQEGNLRHMNARQQSAAKALALAERLAQIGGAL